MRVILPLVFSSAPAHSSGSYLEQEVSIQLKQLELYYHELQQIGQGASRWHVQALFFFFSR